MTTPRTVKNVTATCLLSLFLVLGTVASASTTSRRMDDNVNSAYMDDIVSYEDMTAGVIKSSIPVMMRRRGLLAEDLETELEIEVPEPEAEEEEPVAKTLDNSTALPDAVVARACPIDLEGTTSEGAKMSKFLEDLVDPCTVGDSETLTEDGVKDFCQNCVRPLQNFLAREFHLADLMRAEEETWDADDSDIHEKCALDACKYLESKGMPYDENFHIAVLGCVNFAEDPSCTIPIADIMEDEYVKKAVEGCQASSDSITLMPMGSNASSGEIDADDSTEAEDKHPFCNLCYWPFFEAVVKMSMSEEFMCRVKNEGKDMDPFELEREVLEDPHMFACLLNIEGHMREQGMHTAYVGYTQMEAICFNDLNHPTPDSTQPVILDWMTHDDMQERMAGLSCAR